MTRNLRAEPLTRWLNRDPNEPGISKSTRHNILYYRQLAIATPSWASQSGIKAWYTLAQEQNMEVDHIVPLNHPYVCGLHCEDNFQLLSSEQNLAKSNHDWPDSPYETLELPLELFTHYQLELPL